MKFKTVLVLMVTLAFLVSCKKKGDKEEKTKKPEVAKKVVVKKPVVKKPVVKVVKKPVVKVVKKPTGPTEAVATEIEGKVEVKKSDADEFVMATTNMEFAEGDHIRVAAANANIKLRLWDESTIVLGPGSEAVLNAGADLGSGSPSITMLTGTSSLMIEPRSEEQSVFTVYTPSAVLSVLGTEFEVGISDSGQVKLGVEEGLVEVTDQDGNNKIEVPKGKQIEVSFAGKVSPVKAYDPEKEDWNKWFEAQTKSAQGQVGTLTKVAADRLLVLKNKIKDLEDGIALMETKSAELATKAEEAAKKKDAKVYTVETKPLVENLQEVSMASKQNRKLSALLNANAYMLRRLNALVKAGVIKPKKGQLAQIAALNTDTDKWLIGFRTERLEKRRYRRNRRLKWRARYRRHSPRGRRIARKTGVKLPDFFVKLPEVKRRHRKHFKPKYLKKFKWHSRPKYRGKPRKVRTKRRRGRNWFKRASSRKRDKNRIKKLRRLKNRMKRMKRRSIVIKPRIRRRRRRRPGMGRRPMINPRVVTPGVKVRVPGVKVRVPGARVNIPGVKVRVPGVRIGPGMRMRHKGNKGHKGHMGMGKKIRRIRTKREMGKRGMRVRRIRRKRNK
jgi:FecR protein